MTPILSLALMLSGATHAAAQAFDTGSNGSNGALNVTTDTTLDLPPDGTFHFTTLTVAAGASLRFNKNALNTPVTILATGDVVIDGVIDVSGSGPVGALGGRGGPGGFDGGDAATIGGVLPAGDGHGPGGSTGGGIGTCVAAHVTDGCGATAYGNALLIPLEGGSGSGGQGSNGNFGGAGGGGAILVASNTRILLRSPGAIRAGPAFLASGGSIRLLAPTVGGNGLLDLSGGGGGSAGRGRIDTLDPHAARGLVFGGTTQVIGTAMAVTRIPMPTLAIINVAGTDIAEGAPAPVSITLPFGSALTQPVTVRARGFTGIVPLEIVGVPVSGFRSVVTVNLDMAGQPSAETTVNVTFPQSMPTSVYVWTR